MTVLDVFQIQGRGTVITGSPGPQAQLVRRGAPIELDSPTRGSIYTSIREVEMFRNCFSPDRPRPLGILLAETVPSEHLPASTKVYYANHPQAA